MRAAVTPRPPIQQHTFALPVVRELPAVARPGAFASTW
jgi:hypothetical protein